MKITEFSVSKRLSTVAIVFAFLVLGGYGFANLPVDLLPDITYPMIRIGVVWSGATPEEVEKNIAEIVERQVARVDNLYSMESTCSEGRYSCVVNFDYGADIDSAYQDVTAAMDRVTRQLPDEADPPTAFKADPSQIPVMQISVASDEWDLVRLREWAEDWLQDQFLAVPGVASVEISGGYNREIRVELDPEALTKHALTQDAVMRRLDLENTELFAGRVYEGYQEITSKTAGEFKSIEQIRSVIVLRKGNSVLRLSDLASVEDDHEDARVEARLNDRPSVSLSISKQATANTVSVADNVAAKVASIADQMPAGVRMVVVENQANYVRDALDGVISAAVQAAILLVIIVFFFLGSLRQVVVLCVSLPVILILNFGLMRTAGFTLNIFSLGGLVIALGILLDNSIVVIESITRTRDENPDMPAAEAVVKGTSEVGPAVVAATLSFMALFLPFLLVPGLTSLLFKELILVIAGMVVISLCIALTFTPMMSSLFSGRTTGGAGAWFVRQFNRFINLYGAVLEWVIRQRLIVSAFFIALVILAYGLYGGIGSEFLPKMDDGRLSVRVRLPTGTAVGETDKVARQVEKLVGYDPPVKSVSSTVGGFIYGATSFDMSHSASVNILLVPAEERTITTDAYVNQLRQKLNSISAPGGTVTVSQQRIRGLRTVGSSDIDIKFRGPDTQTLMQVSSQAAALLRESATLGNVSVSIDFSRPEYRVVIDRERASAFGLSTDEIANGVQRLVTGSVATRYREGDKYYPVRVSLPRESVNSRSVLQELFLVTSAGDTVRLSDVATVERGTGPVQITRENQFKQVAVTGDAVGISVSDAVEEAKRILAELEIPEGYEVVYSGQAEMMGDMMKNVALILGFAVFFAFIVLTVQFNSLVLPSLILGSIPFSLAGMVFALYIMGIPFAATVIIGVLVVVAAVVNDGVLLLTYAIEQRDTLGKDSFSAVVEAAKVRLRPRLMTTITTMIGFLPLALNLDKGGEMLQPMALAAIGGLTVETLVALFLMPCMFVMFTRR